ncbi:MAG TPA: amidohydrolase family protein [Gemmatimonadaceae bacterium]|nr:amidohydrolase family protein [Gemmatimonadaceae bacterium]
MGAPLLRDACVAVEGDRIAFVGARHAAPSGEDVELGQCIVVPGLVNTHTHLDLAAFDGALDGLPFFTWVRTLVRGLAEASSGDALADAAMWSVADQLAHGVTTIGHTGPSAVAADAMHALGARGVVYLECFAPDPKQCNASLADLRARVSRARERETALVAIGVSPHAPYSVSDALYASVAEYARAERLPVAVHIAESAEETDLVVRAAGPFADMLRARGIAVSTRAESPVALLERVGVLSARTLCIHAVRLDAGDADRLASAGASVAHCPRANAWFGNAAAPVAELLSHGIGVGVGTDSIASNGELRVLAEASAAADAALSSADRLALATMGGARALGMESRVGTLEPGKQADVAAFAVSDADACDRDPARYLLQHCASNNSALTIVAGHVRSQNGHVVGVDDSLAQRMKFHRMRVRAWRVAAPENTGAPREPDSRFRAWSAPGRVEGDG